MAPKAAKGDVLQQKSPAEFFADNRTIAGFDNVRRRRVVGAGFPASGRSPEFPIALVWQQVFPNCRPHASCSPASACIPPFASW